MKKIKFEYLIDVNTVKTVEVEVPDDFDTKDLEEARKAGREAAERIRLSPVKYRAVCGIERLKNITTSKD